MDVKKGKLNIAVSVSFKIITMIASLIVKGMLIRTCGNEVNGLNALYLSIVGFLSVAELGVCGAITYCMYKPIVEGENDKVSALFYLFRKLYIIIGSIILLAGLIITPFLNYFAKDYKDINQNLYLTFILVLISIVITYAYGAESALIGAYKNNYIVTVISQSGVIIRNVLQIVVLALTGSFVWYLVCRIVSSTIELVVTKLIVAKKYRTIVACKNSAIDANTKANLKRNIKAMFMHKIGFVLVNTVDSIVISTFIGVFVLGKYSNYITIMSSMSSIIALMFSSLTSVFGHLYVEEDVLVSKRHCDSFHLLNFIIGAVFFLGYHSVIDDLVSLIFSADLLVDRSLCLVITVNGFVQFMRQSALAFRDATGAFYNDRWKPPIEGAFNLILSVLLVKYIGVSGVILATIITNLFICHIIEPYVLYKNSFKASPKTYYFRNYIMISMFLVALMILESCMVSITNHFASLLINGCISVAISVAACIVIILAFNKTTKYLIEIWRNKR